MTVTTDYFPPPGEPVDPAAMQSAKARQLRDALQGDGSPFARLLECRREEAGGNDVVVIEVEVELPQHGLVHDIRRFERLAIVFTADDRGPPDVLALRCNFPLTPHTNLQLAAGRPRSLCLYDESYDEVKLRWTAAQFVERSRVWLADTARGALHRADQPLEPLLPGALTQLVLPDHLWLTDPAQVPEWLAVRRLNNSELPMFLVAEPLPDQPHQGEGILFVAMTLYGTPQPHGVITWWPSTVFDLHQFARAANIDLLTELRTQLRSWDRTEQLLNAQVIMVLDLPKTRHSRGVAEEHDFWAFLCLSPIRDLGEQLGLWQMHGDLVGWLLAPDQTKQGDQADIHVIQPLRAYSRALATTLNGTTPRDGRRLVAVGVGALGSQAVMQLIRMGVGEWTLIDDDRLLPHNLARHALVGPYLGMSKAEALAEMATITVAGERIATAISADVLHPGDKADAIAAVLQEADVVVDASASVAVARHLTRDITSPARRVSMFLNPSGTDLVVLAEDAQRSSSLDWLEMQYYRQLLHEPALAGHLQQPNERVRYGQSCRDLSAILPQDLVALHAAIAARAVRETATSDAATIDIWQANPTDLSVVKHAVTPCSTIECRLGSWTLCTDAWFVAKVAEARRAKLPNETGGVLVGTIDQERRIIYVVDALMSPPDSTEWPTVYIRGCRGLPEQLATMRSMTDEMLDYVGEWHSHPAGHGCKPSYDDRTAFTWLAQEMAVVGLPALMLIVGEGSQVGWYLGEMPLA